MPKFNVTASEVIYYETIEIEAKDAKEAEEKYEALFATQDEPGMEDSELRVMNATLKEEGGE